MKKICAVLAALAALTVLIFAYPLVSSSNAPKQQKLSKYNKNVTEQIDALVESKESIDALMIASSDQILYSSGDASKPINTHSIRKSIMSVLIGMSIKDGMLTLDQTLEELSVDDAVSPLTELEKTATVENLLMSRSGIYISSAGEHDDQITKRPQRGQHKPGEVYFSNNWDFNALDTVLEEVGLPAQHRTYELARKLKFEDFNQDHFYYQTTDYSEHKQYTMFMSARDLIKVGQLILRNGITREGIQIISPEWVRKSTTSYTEVNLSPYTGFAYMWWTDDNTNTIWSDGWGGQFMMIDRANDLVIVSRNNTGRRLGELLWLSVLGNASNGSQYNLLKLRDIILGKKRNVIDK